MKKTLSIILFLTLYVTLLNAQTRRSSFRTTDSTIELEERADPEVVYLFKNYSPAIIYYPDGYAEMDINYRLLRDEITAMDPSGETKALSTHKMFDSIVVRDMLLVYDNRFGYLEKAKTSQKPFFIKHQSTYTMNEIIQGAYGQASPVSSTQSVNILGGGNEYLGIRHNRVTLENTSGNEVQVNITAGPVLGLMEENEFKQMGSRKDVNRLFPSHRKQIRSFLRSENISFDNRTDLLKLALFLDELSR